jgi:hypothetical protein
VPDYTTPRQPDSGVGLTNRAPVRGSVIATTPVSVHLEDMCTGGMLAKFTTCADTA